METPPPTSTEPDPEGPPESFILICDDQNSLYTLRPAGGLPHPFPTRAQALAHACGMIREATFITYHDGRGILVQTSTLWPDGTQTRLSL